MTDYLREYEEREACAARERVHMRSEGLGGTGIRRSRKRKGRAKEGEDRDSEGEW